MNLLAVPMNKCKGKLEYIYAVLYATFCCEVEARFASRPDCFTDVTHQGFVGGGLQRRAQNLTPLMAVSWTIRAFGSDKGAACGSRPS